MKNSRLSRLLTTLLLAASLVSCSSIPIYQPPSDLSASAQLKLSFKDESFLTGIGQLSRTDGDIICKQKLPNYEKMIRISKGRISNPLVSNLNASGVYIPAGRKLTLSAMAVNDGFPPCNSRIISFVPKIGSIYQVNLTNTTVKLPVSAPAICEMELVEVSPDLGTQEPVEVTYEKCIPAQ